jgi:hypothetical protein
MKNLRVIAFAVIMLSMAALACSVGGVSQAPEVVATVKAVATEVQSSATATPQAASAPSGGDDTLSLSSRDAGLDKLKSYRMTWQAQWAATDSGDKENAGWDWVEEYSSDPAALHYVWHITDSTDPSKDTNMEAWQMGNTMYIQMQDSDGKSQCMSFSSEDQSSQLTKGLFNPNTLGSVSDAKYVGTDTVNGVQAKHYKYDEKSAALFAAAKVAGDIWVAVDGGYVVKETVNWTGASGLFGSGSDAKGDGKWNWELSNVDQPIDIKPPEGCGGAAADIPIMGDATEKSSFGDTITYKSATKLTDVVDFYQNEMKNAGWTLEGEPMISDEVASLEFSKDGQTATIMLTTDQGTTQVMITVQQ